MNNRRGIVKHLSFMIIQFSILGLLLIFSYITWSNYSIIKEWSKIITNLAIILLSIQLISFKYKKVDYTDFRLWYIILTYIFMFGRVFLNGYGLDGNIFWNLMVRHSIVDLYHTSLFILCSIQSIFIGFVIKENKKQVISKSIEIWKEPGNELMYKVGIFLLICSVPFRLYTDLSWILQTQGTGSYLALTVSSGLADDIAFLVVPSLIYIITSGKIKHSFVIPILFTSIAYFIIVMILTGDRRYPASAIVALFLCYLRLYNIKLFTRKTIIWGIGAFWLLNILAILRNIRHNDLTSIGNFISNYGSDILFGKSTLYETLSEFGLSFFSVVHIFEYVPSYIPFQHGFSFLASIPSVLPIGWLFRDFFSKASLSGIINPLAGAPVGASLIGDLYGNFGWYSLIAGIILGKFSYRVFRIENKKVYRLGCAQYYSMFYILINLVRATFIEIFRPAIIVYFIPVILIRIFKSKYVSKEKNNIGVIR